MSPKPESQEITATEIAACLEGQDSFALEMRVLQICKQAKCGVTHGWTYEDPMQKKTRQYDLRVLLELSLEHRIRMAVECKNLRSPLLISSVNRETSESYYDVTDVQWANLGELNFYSVKRVEDDNMLYSSQQQVGKTMAQVSRKSGKVTLGKDEEVYEGWSQAVSSAHDLIVAALNEVPGQNQRLLTIVWPCLVVNDGMLWVIPYNEFGSPSEPAKIDECTYVLGKKYKVVGIHGEHRYTLSHLHIFTYSGFKMLLWKLTTHRGHWRNLYFPENGLNEPSL